MTLVYYFIQQIVNALSIGSLYALMAVGLAMVFGILRLINFAHGDMMMVAAYIAAHASEVDDNGRRLVVRNGHAKPRQVLTTWGSIVVF